MMLRGICYGSWFVRGYGNRKTSDYSDNSPNLTKKYSDMTVRRHSISFSRGPIAKKKLSKYQINRFGGKCWGSGSLVGGGIFDIWVGGWIIIGCIKK